MSAEAAIMNPVTNVLALQYGRAHRAGGRGHVIGGPPADLRPSGRKVLRFTTPAQREDESHTMTSQVVYWQWTSRPISGSSPRPRSSTGRSMCTRRPARFLIMAVRRRADHQHRVSDDGKWCLLTSIATGIDSVVNGTMQLYSIELKVSQTLQGRADASTPSRCRARRPGTSALLRGEEAGPAAKLFVMEVGRQGRSRRRLPAAAADRPVRPTTTCRSRCCPRRSRPRAHDHQGGTPLPL